MFHCGFTSRTAHTLANHKLVEAYTVSVLYIISSARTKDSGNLGEE